MGYSIVPFEAEHAARLRDIDPRSGFDPAWVDDAWATELVNAIAFGNVDAWAAVTESGDVLGIAGFDWHHPGHATAWAVWGRGWRRHARALTADVLAIIECVNEGCRLDATVMTDDFPGGHAWVRKLGFRRIARRMEKYWPNGEACDLYERVR